MPGCVGMLCFANGLSVIVAVERALEAIFDASLSFEQSLPDTSAVYATRISKFSTYSRVNGIKWELEVI